MHEQDQPSNEERELERIFADDLGVDSLPTPPPDLAERIKAEIPDDLGVRRGSAQGVVVRRWRHPGVLALAATAVLAAGLWMLMPMADQTVEQRSTRTDAEHRSPPSSEPAQEARSAEPDTAGSVGESVAGSATESVDGRVTGTVAMAVAKPAAEAGAEAEHAQSAADGRVGMQAEANRSEARKPAQPSKGTERDRREEQGLNEELVKMEALSSLQAEAVRDTRPRERRPVNDAPHDAMYFDSAGVNPYVDTEDDARSTFGLDVDTASYAVVRRYLQDGHLPPREAVRVEELLNSFDYGDPPPAGEAGGDDFALHAEVAPSRWAPDEGRSERYYLLRFGLRARDVIAAERPPALLTFVVDVSGSMAREDRLGLVKRSLGLLLDHLRADDRVALVVYGSEGRVLLEPTSDHQAVRAAIERLHPEGSTNAAEGLRLGYELTARHLRPGQIHRVILCSDGVANTGTTTSAEGILAEVERWGRQGVELTTVGFGMGNYNDALMETLANRGNGRYAYLDSLDEARRLFVDDLTGTLTTVAAEARAQVTFDPEIVSRYRLLGYENRDIADQRFRDDTIDGGEIGAGHAVTVLYEIKTHRPLRASDLPATMTLRYASIARGEMVEQSLPVTGRMAADSFAQAPKALRLAATVATFAEVLRASYWTREVDLGTVFAEAQKVSADWPGDLEVAEFAVLVGKAERLRDAGQRK